MITVTQALLALAAVQAIEFLGLAIVAVSVVSLRRRHDRVVNRVNVLSKGLTKVSRLRHTGEHTTPTPAATAIIPRNPTPPYPVPPPATVPIAPARGRHSR